MIRIILGILGVAIQLGVGYYLGYMDAKRKFLNKSPNTNVHVDFDKNTIKIDEV